jgi:hypothetical protein
MGTLDWFNRAKREALDIIESVGGGDRIGVIAFARTPRVLAALSSDEALAGDRNQARRAIETAQLTEESTAFLPALQRAQELLIGDPGPSEQVPGRLVVHLITDFQKQGMPDRAPGWKLSRQVTLDPVEIGNADVSNLSVVDLGIRETQSNGLRIQGKVKNWSPEEDRPVDVRLVVNGATAAVNTLSVTARNASQTSFSVAAKHDELFEGWIEIDDDTLATDNKRYFSRNPKRKTRVFLVADDQPGKRWAAAALLTPAVPEQADVPWTLAQVQQTDLIGQLRRDESSSDVLLVCDLNGIGSTISDAILAHARKGGCVFLVLGGTMAPADFNRSLLSALGIRSAGLRYQTTRETQFDLLSWVDLDHTIFFPFRGSRFNDFSHVRFFNYHRLELTGSGQTAPRVLARFDTADASDMEPDRELPAIVEVPLGEGRVILWAFGIDLDWSTLPRSPRFVPMVHETLAYLTGKDEQNRLWQVGDQPTSPERAAGRAAQWLVAFPQESSESALKPAEQPVLRRAGFLRWKPDTQLNWDRVEAVNADPREGDPTRITPAEFELRLCAAPVLDQGVAAGTDTNIYAGQENPVLKREYGWYIICLVFAVLMLESVYASYLSRRPLSAGETQ